MKYSPYHSCPGFLCLFLGLDFIFDELWEGCVAAKFSSMDMRGLETWRGYAALKASK